MNPTRQHPSCHLLGSRWIEGEGTAFSSHDPASGAEVWRGRAATAAEVDAAVRAAREAFESSWADRPIEQRVTILEAFAEKLREHHAEMAEIISRETGKPRWEANEEASAMVNKVAVSITAHRARRSDTETVLSATAGQRLIAATRFRPHGVVAVFGPFNFPGHLPNGHIVPALLAGNTVVFKPSEMTPATALRTIELWQAAGLPDGAINLVQGGRETGMALAGHAGIDGLFFTGSAAAGLSLHRGLAGQVQKILALELGGNNPLIAWDVGDAEAAAYVAIQSAYLTAGQRCTCARRLILPADARGDAVLDRLLPAVGKIRVGPFTQTPEPFMGPVISSKAADQVLTAQEDLLRRGGRALAAMKRMGGGGAMLSPGVIDVTDATDRPDVEIFGPLLQVIRVADFDAAIAEANHTAYGLSAGLLSDDAGLYDVFRRRIRAGIVNWNRATTGASGTLPFGGIGLSGNHRPSGYHAVDYCSYAVASMETETLAIPAQKAKGLDDAFAK